MSSRFVSVLPTFPFSSFFFFNDTATTEIYTLSLHDALPIYAAIGAVRTRGRRRPVLIGAGDIAGGRNQVCAPVCADRSGTCHCRDRRHWMAPRAVLARWRGPLHRR